MATDKQKAEQAEKDKAAEAEAEKNRLAAEQAEKDKTAAEQASSEQKSTTEVSTANAATNPGDTANAATEGGAEQRLANSTNAEEGQNEGVARTQLEAMQESALRARMTGDAVVSPKSQTLQNPDAELRAELTNDALTAAREALSRQVGETPDADRLIELFDAVTAAQKKVDEAIAERDAARDAYDRGLEASAINNAQTHETTIGGYLEAQNRQRERQAQMNERAYQQSI